MSSQTPNNQPHNTNSTTNTLVPRILPKPLYKHQAQRLLRNLKKAFVKARLISV
ncbi:MAG: hypothetical protein F6K54_40930 [Okeania sp. SIO3B5]|uniref:hypothetical protein n=1 Tax=Okeania sp. SIO3B5 TaxID=2607811 RepID=UPI001401A4A6|nr:hypothetical protein [Okeania sp. SIO3B5]NEO58842.1 hypothetical protein [Okeania sp. SIO3B5]